MSLIKISKKINHELIEKILTQLDNNFLFNYKTKISFNLI